MTHKNYFEIKADTYRELGASQGKLFRAYVQAALVEKKALTTVPWNDIVVQAKPYLEATSAVFPKLIEEAQGYAEGAQVPFSDLWLLLCEDELEDDDAEKCTTIVTNEGALLSHNEDWTPAAEDYICLLRKTVAGFTILELHYIGTLGGNAVSINSHGVVQSINSLTHADGRVGVPRNMIARWMSQTSDPDRDFARMKTIRRAAGYHHGLLNTKRQLWSIECSAKRQKLRRPKFPFVHTNHYQTELEVLEHDDGQQGTYSRCERAQKQVEPTMTGAALKTLTRDVADGAVLSIFNERTIGQMIFDLKAMTASVWLKREASAGWIDYSLADFRGGD